MGGGAKGGGVKGGGQKVRSPKGGGLKGGGPQGGEPNISRFLSFFSCKYRSFVSLWGSPRELVAAVRGRGPPKVRVWAALGSFCETPAACCKTP